MFRKIQIKTQKTKTKINHAKSSRYHKNITLDMTAHKYYDFQFFPSYNKKLYLSIYTYKLILSV